MRARRWTAKIPNVLPIALLSLAVILAIVIVLRAEEKQKHEAAVAEKVEQEQSALVQLLQEDQLKIQAYLRSWPHAQAPHEAKPKRRGIVICAGGNKLLINAYVSLKVLRKTLGSQLPVEIYHNGPQDVGPVTRAAFNAFTDVKFIDLSTLGLPAHQRRPKLYNGYVQKILSLYLTQFEEVLLLDADSQPLKDPSEIFDSSGFKQYGNVFWPDFWREGNSESPAADVYRWVGLAPPWESTLGWQCAESGQVFFDKARHADVLEWLWFLNSHAELFYEHMLGDKDTFEMAFMLAGKHADFHRVPISPGVPLTQMYGNIRRGGWRERYMKREEPNRYFRVGMLQFDASGAPAFMHRTERTKFANWENGYTLEMMRPKFILPSFGPDIPKEAKAAAWNLHSLPRSMVVENCTCCAHTPGALAVVTAASGYRAASQEGFAKLGQVMSASTGAGGQQCTLQMWSQGDVTMPKFPLYPTEYFGSLLKRPLDAGFDAYEDIKTLLGTQLQWRLSP